MPDMTSSRKLRYALHVEMKNIESNASRAEGKTNKNSLMNLSVYRHRKTFCKINNIHNNLFDVGT